VLETTALYLPVIMITMIIMMMKTTIIIIIIIIIIIQFNSIYLCAKLNSPEANYKASTGMKMGRVRSKKEN
jgi:uncharacterized membrane protein